MANLSLLDLASRSRPMARKFKKGGGGKLTYAERQKMPSSEFALPGAGTGPKGRGGGSYPIPDASHARNALARVSQHGTPEEKARVRAAVHRKFPGIEQQRLKYKHKMA